MYHCDRCKKIFKKKAWPYEFNNACKVVYGPCSDCGGEIKAGFPKVWVNDTMGGGRQYANTKFSQSMAISPSQIAAHKKIFPDVAVKPNGEIGFNSVQQEHAYLEATGFHKHSQKLR